MHGAWHGAWCWAPLQAALDELGVASQAVDLPGHGTSPLPLADLHGDARCVADAALAIGGRIVLVGHSYGGAVVTQAAEFLRDEPGAEVTHIVYLAAFCLDEGESVSGFVASQPRENPLLNSAMIPGKDGTVVLDPAKAAPALYNRMSPAQAAAAVARLGPESSSGFAQAVTGAPWRHTPSTYVVCEQDLSVHPNHQRAMAARCTNEMSLDTDHSPFASMPRETAAILAATARA